MFYQRNTLKNRGKVKKRASYTWLFTSQILTIASEVPVPRIKPSGWNAAEVYPLESVESTTCRTEDCQIDPPESMEGKRYMLMTVRYFKVDESI